MNIRYKALNFFALLSVAWILAIPANAENKQLSVSVAKPHDFQNINTTTEMESVSEQIVHQRIKDLENLVSKQQDIINDLRIDTNVLIEQPRSFEAWCSILLGASALIVTALGVIVAFLAFFGYHELVNKGAKTAEDRAVEEAKKVMDTLLQDKTKDILDTLIADGYLIPVVEEIANKVMYRNIEIDDDFTN